MATWDRPRAQCSFCSAHVALTKAGNIYRHDSLQQVSLRANHMRRFLCPGSGRPPKNSSESAKADPAVVTHG